MVPEADVYRELELSELLDRRDIVCIPRYQRCLVIVRLHELDGSVSPLLPGLDGWLCSPVGATSRTAKCKAFSASFPSFLGRKESATRRNADPAMVLPLASLKPHVGSAPSAVSAKRKISWKKCPRLRK